MMRLRNETLIARGECSMKMIIGLFVVILVSGLSGCMTHTVGLRNASGETVQCKGNAEEVDACAEKYKAAGYKKVEEAPMKNAPKGGSGY
jgi:hypothetical protein